MEYLYALIIVASSVWEENNSDKMPYSQVNSIFQNYEDCNRRITEIHDLYLAKDIRRKDSKRRKPRFIRGHNNEKILKYTHRNKNFYASCKMILENSSK